MAEGEFVSEERRKLRILRVEKVGEADFTTETADQFTTEARRDYRGLFRVLRRSMNLQRKKTSKAIAPRIASAINLGKLG
jgi:hypothetical protein